VNFFFKKKQLPLFGRGKCIEADLVLKIYLNLSPFILFISISITWDFVSLIESFLGF
jgi:hypothetical protein